MKRNKNSIRRLIISLLIFAIVMVLFSFMIPDFLNANNIISCLREASFIGIIAVGVTFVIITGGIDISVGSTMALTSLVCADLLRYTNVNLVIAIVATLVVGIICGAINGFIVSKFKLPDFIVTLATMNIFRGLTTTFTRNDVESMQNAMIKNSGFETLGTGVGKVYYVIILFVIVAVVGQFVLGNTKLGTYTYAIGSDANAAALTGISNAKVKVFAYTLTGFLAGLAGLMVTARMMTANAYTGEGMEFNVIAAIVLGGCSLQGGRGNIWGTVVGTLLISFVNTGTTQMGIQSDYQPIIKGLIIFVAVFFDVWYYNHSKKKDTVGNDN